MSLKSQSFDRPSSMKTICAVSVAIDDSTPQGNRYVGLLECDRIVDAVADEAHLAPFFLQLLDILGLVCGQHLSKVVVHSQASASLRVGAS